MPRRYNPCGKPEKRHNIAKSAHNIDQTYRAAGEFEAEMKRQNSNSDAQIYLTKIAIAERQLNAAIRLTLQEEDHVATPLDTKAFY